MDDDDLLSQIHAHDRVSIPAILIVDGDDGLASPIAAGIFDPVTIPVTFGDDATILMGDCFTANVTAVFIPDDDGLDDSGHDWPGDNWPGDDSPGNDWPDQHGAESNPVSGDGGAS